MESITSDTNVFGRSLLMQNAKLANMNWLSNWRWRRTEKSQQALDASKNTFLLHAMDTIIHIYMTLRSIADPMDKHKCRKNVKIWQMKIEKNILEKNENKNK